MPPKLAKELVRPIARPIFGGLGWLEGKLLPAYQLQYSPVFIVGLPRSGTTLLSQVINYALATSYFTNLATHLRVQLIPRPPVIFSAWLARALKLLEYRQEDFRSYYGLTQGWGNPNDSTMVWQHWFPNRYMEAGELSLEAQQAVYQAVAGTERIFGRPFVDKSAENCVRIRALAEIFPTALFIRPVRNPLAIAQSIYVGRTQTIHKPEYWFSTRPKQIEELLQASLIEQICGQVYYLEQNLLEGLAVVAPERVLSVVYSEMCLNPQQQIERILDFMNRNGAPTEQIHAIPTQFPLSSKRQVDTATYQALIEQLERFYGYEMTRLDEPES